MFYANPIKALLFIIPFIPLYFSNSLFFPYVTGKAFIFRIIVEIVFAAWLLLAIFYKEYRPQKTYLLWAIGIFIAVVTLATILGVNPARSFWSNFERMEGLITHFHLFAYFLVLAHVFRKKDWFIFFNLFVFAGLIINIFGLLQKFGYLLLHQPDFRIDSTIGNPISLAVYLIFVLAFSVLLLIHSQNKFARYYYGFVGLFSLVTIYFTASRGPILALLVGSIIAAVFFLIFFRAATEKGKLHKKIIAFILTVVVVAPLLFWALKDTQLVQTSPVLRRFADLSFSERSIKSRLVLWNISWQGFKERPILGWGPENYTIVASKYYDPALYTERPWFDRSHNIILDWLINAGILGLLAYLSIFWAALYLLWKLYVKNILSLETGILISVLLLVYLLQNFFVFDDLIAYISFFTVLAYIHGLAVSSVLVQQQEQVRPAQIFLVSGFLLVFLTLIIYFVNGKPLMANWNTAQALKIQNQDLPAAFEKYNRALSYNTFGNAEIREQLAKFAINIKNSSRAALDLKERVFQKTIIEFQKSVSENSLDPRPHLFLGVIYSQGGLLDDALRLINRSLDLAPRKQQIYFELADVYIRKSDYKQAIAVLKTALDLEPNYDLARTNLAKVVEFEQNQNLEAEK